MANGRLLKSFFKNLKLHAQFPWIIVDVKLMEFQTNVSCKHLSLTHLTQSASEAAGSVFVHIILSYLAFSRNDFVDPV